MRHCFPRSSGGAEPVNLRQLHMTSPTQASNPDPVSWAEVARSMIDAENRLINDRVGWLTTLQGLLFAGLGVVWDKSNATALIRMLCGLGMSISIIILLALIGSSRAQNRVLDWWDSNRPSDYTGPDVIGLRPPPNKFLRHLAPWNWLALVFLLTWIIIWLIRARY